MASARAKLSELARKAFGLEQLEEDRRKLRRHLQDLYTHAITIQREQTELWRAVQALQADLATQQVSSQTHQDRVDQRLRTFGEALHGFSKRVDHAVALLQQDCHTPQGALQQPRGSVATAPDSGGQVRHLPSALREIVSVLFDAEQPLSYGQIARRLGKAPATARSYIHRLQERGFPLEFSEEFSGKKKVRLPLEIRRKLAIPG